MKTEYASDFRDFFTGYLVCALWSSHDNADEGGGEPMDANYDLTCIAFRSLLEMARECKDFMTTQAEPLARYAEKMSDRGEWTAMERAGHDFWLTKNGHGAGFWGRGLGQLGRELTDASKVYGSTDLYVGDDGKVYC